MTPVGAAPVGQREPSAHSHGAGAAGLPHGTGAARPESAGADARPAHRGNESAATRRLAEAATDGDAAHPAAPRRPLHSAAFVAGLAAVLIASILIAITLGSAHLSLGEVLRALATHLGVNEALRLDPLTTIRDAIVWELRVPRVLTAAAVGAGLALCGAILQALTRNPLADPYLLGLSSGASLGAVSVLLLGVSVALPAAAFAGAMLALTLTVTLGGRGSMNRTVLAGIAVSQGCSAVVSLVIFWTATGDSYREILSWLMGSLAGAQWKSAAIVWAAAIIGIALCFVGNVLDAFGFGDDAATALGVPAGRVRLILFVATALLTGALVSQSGAIGFVGLILPHGVRMVVGSSYRVVLPVSALAGAIFLIWADTAARTVFSPRELPVGVVTSAIGVPVFAWLLRRRSKVALARPAPAHVAAGVEDAAPSPARGTELGYASAGCEPAIPAPALRGRAPAAQPTPGSARFPRPTLAPATGEFGLRAAGVAWAADGTLIIDGVDCVAPAGTVTGLIGPNGSGKSTLLRVLAGLRAPAGGTVMVGDRDLAALSARSRARVIAAVEQAPQPAAGMTALNAVLLGRIPHRSLLASATRQDTSAALESLRQAGVLHAAQRDISTLSGGERQRVHIARALAQEPAVLVLDEPTTYLDVGAQLDVLRLLREVAARGVTVIAAIHELTLAADFCDRAIMLDRGRVRAAGQASEVLRPRLIAEVYGVRCRRLTDPATGESVLSFA